MSDAPQRRVVLYAASSLDGYLARSDGSVDWLPPPTPHADFGYAEFLARVDTLVMGRKTYEQVRALGPWPYPGRKTWVFSRAQTGPRPDGVEFVAADLETSVRRWKRERGRDLWLLGGGELVAACLEAGVVDEVIVTIAPALLGSGVPLFAPRSDWWPARLRLVTTQVLHEGMVQLVYEVAA